MNYQAVLFDFDYTLGDATASIYEGFCFAFERMGLPQPELEAVRRTVGHVLDDEFTMLTGITDPAKHARFKDLFHQVVVDTQAEKTVLFPGALELLQALHSRGVKLGVVSSKRSDTLGKVLTRHGAIAYLDFYTGGEKVARPKPDPEGLNAGITALGADRAAVLYCGDTTIDAGTARNAGVDFAAVLNGTTPAEEFDSFPSVFVAKDLWALKGWLGV